MSLKAKIEAVIYASEEPVTLAQLMGLLSEEAQAELDAMAAQQTLLDLGDEEPQDDSAETSATEAGKGDAAENAAPTAGESADTSSEGTEDSNDPVGSPEATAAQGEAGGDAPQSGAGAETEATPEAIAAADEKKVARQRERVLREYFRSLLDALIAEYATGDRGLEIREVAGGFRLATKPEYHDAVRGFVKSLKPPLKLSLQALETLAVVAYKQPVTAPEVSEIRGVDSGGVLAGLMARKLVATAGRKAVIGRPILYKTTKEFLVRFGLRDINELPSIEEFERMASELAAEEPMQEEIPMDDQAPRGNVSEESGDASAALDELDSAPAASGGPHETVGEMESDKGASEGAGHEPSQDVEPMRDVHEAQADGIPSEDAPEGSTDRTGDSESGNSGGGE